MTGFWGDAYTKLQRNHPILAQIVCKGTAIGYLLIWWLGFIVVFGTVILGAPYLFYANRTTIKDWWIYDLVWIVIISLPVLIGFIGGWIYDKGTKNISN
jgi:hypothetical protein